VTAEVLLPDIQSVPLGACRLEPENARHAVKGSVEGLSASIAAEGLLDPLPAYQDGERLMVWDGGRRLARLSNWRRPIAN
jgi:hypothetical protein